MPDSELTLEQQFELKKFKDATKNMTREKAINMAIKATRLLMVKTNIARHLVRK